MKFQAFLTAVENGCGLYLAAYHAGLDSDVVIERMWRDSDFREAVSRARRVAYEKVKLALWVQAGLGRVGAQKLWREFQEESNDDGRLE